MFSISDHPESPYLAKPHHGSAWVAIGNTEWVIGASSATSKIRGLLSGSYELEIGERSIGRPSFQSFATIPLLL